MRIAVTKGHGTLSGDVIGTSFPGPNFLRRPAYTAALHSRGQDVFTWFSMGVFDQDGCV